MSLHCSFGNTECDLLGQAEDGNSNPNTGIIVCTLSIQDFPHKIMTILSSFIAGTVTVYFLTFNNVASAYSQIDGLERKVRDMSHKLSKISGKTSFDQLSDELIEKESEYIDWKKSFSRKICKDMPSKKQLSELSKQSREAWNSNITQLASKWNDMLRK